MTQRPDGYRRYETEEVFDALEAFEREAFGRGVSMAGLALAWLLGVPDVTAVVVGPTRAEQLEPVREALALELTLGRPRPSARLVRVIVLSEHDVRELLDMESCIEAMTEVLASLARGELYNPLRSIMRRRRRRDPPRAHARVPRRLVARVRAQGDRHRARRTRRAASTRTWAASCCTTARRASCSRS